MTDETEAHRREMIESGQNYLDLARADTHWDTAALQRDFVVHSFLAPYVVVTRKKDNVRGSMEFTHNPRFYFNFVPDTK